MTWHTGGMQLETHDDVRTFCLMPYSIPDLQAHVMSPDIGRFTSHRVGRLDPLNEGVDC